MLHQPILAAGLVMLALMTSPTSASSSARNHPEISHTFQDGVYDVDKHKDVPFIAATQCSALVHKYLSISLPIPNTPESSFNDAAAFVINSCHIGYNIGRKKHLKGWKHGNWAENCQKHCSSYDHPIAQWSIANVIKICQLACVTGAEHYFGVWQDHPANQIKMV